MDNTFKTATAFRASLEAYIKSQAIQKGIDLQTIRRKLAFERFLARINSGNEPLFFLKGGFAMELRIATARATKDIDLTTVIRGSEGTFIDLIITELEELISQDLGDYFYFRIEKTQTDLQNAPYGGTRFHVTALMDGKIFVRFPLDIGGDSIVGPIDYLKGESWLEKYGFSNPKISAISVYQQFAEKIHAYTLPRGENTNSRVKDLIDMILLIDLKKFIKDEFIQILKRVFKIRNTHELPKLLPPPPDIWETRFKTMAKECGLSEDMLFHFNHVSNFYHSLWD